MVTYQILKADVLVRAELFDVAQKHITRAYELIDQLTRTNFMIGHEICIRRGLIWPKRIKRRYLDMLAQKKKTSDFCS